MKCVEMRSGLYQENRRRAEAIAEARAEPHAKERAEAKLESQKTKNEQLTRRS